MTKKDIVNKIQSDLVMVKDLIVLLQKSDDYLIDRLQAQAGYINSLLEWIQQEGKV